jgi:FixJ family two-component response regulator
VPKGPLIAIVDDDESIWDTIKDLLEPAGFSAAVFARAASLLKSRRLSRISCLIADMRMPTVTKQTWAAQAPSGVSRPP